MRVIALYLHRAIRRIPRTLKRWLFKIAVLAMAFLGIIFSLNAEIYKWRDDTGLIYYSNHPPADLSRIIEIIPSQNASSGANSEPKVYYFSAPGGQGNEDFTVPPEVLQELFYEQPQAAIPQSTPTVPQSDPSTNLPDMTAITMRLTQLEGTLEREIETRLQWEQQYAYAQSVIKTLEQENRTLNVALVSMQEDIKYLQGTVVASDMQMAALKQQTQPGQYAMLQHTVTGLQEHVETIALELDSLDWSVLSNQVATLAADISSLKIRQQPDHSLLNRLSSLENTMQHVNDMLPASQQTTEEMSRLKQHGTALTMITGYHDERLDNQQFQIAALQIELDALKASQNPSAEQITGLDDSRSVVAQLVEKNQFMETMIEHQAGTLQAQNEQIKLIKAQLKSWYGQRAAEPVSSGIRIIPRSERRRTSLAGRILNWLATPQVQTSEEE